MLAKVAEELPPAGDFLYEPKWDGFRAMVFRGKDVFIQSRDLRPFDRYFPDLHEAFAAQLPTGCVVDGEIVIVTAAGLDFDALQMRLHPAASRVHKLAQETPASFVAFDALAVAYLDRIHAVADQATRILRSDVSSNERLACCLQAVPTQQTQAELAALVRNRRGESQHRRAADPCHADDQAFAVDQITIAGRDDLLRSQ